MADWATPERWDGLREGLGRNPFVCDRLYSGDTDTGCILGVDEDSQLHLMVRVIDDSAVLPPDLNDITVRYADFDGLVVNVTVDPVMEFIISPVFDSIVKGCMDGRQAMDVITEQLERIRKAFSRSGSEISDNKQIGLVGELFVMLHIMIPAIGPKATLQWSGPLWERHDFVGDRAHVEVKTTTRSMDQHEISRLDQLRIQEGKKLLLASVQLERSIAGEHTIATLRDAILGLLENHGPAIDAFERNLAEMGWHDRLVQSGTLLKFNLRSLSVFLVEGAFPRIPDDYVPPRGVVALTYTINISACPILEPGQVLAMLGPA